MNPAILNIPFVQIALQIMITLIGGIWLNSKSMDTCAITVSAQHGWKSELHR